MKTTTTRKTVSELLATEDAPLPLAVIPNHMGINLCSVDSLSWTKREDGQLVDLTIHFIPAEKVGKCVLCGGAVEMTAKPGRTREMLRGVIVPVPDDFKIPTCSSCGEEFMSLEISEPLDALLMPIAERMKTEVTTLSDFLDKRLREEKGSEVEKLAVVSATQLSVFCAWLLANGMSAEQARAFFETALDGADRLLPQKFRKKL